jgi:osmoprotectant transport system permease protein
MRGVAAMRVAHALRLAVLVLLVALVVRPQWFEAVFAPPATMEAARGIGLSRWQCLTRVEIPLALPVILTGIRLSVVIALGPATIGSTVAACTLGEVIIAGLLTNNTAFVLQGGLIVGLFAVLIYDAMVQVETHLGHGARI